jgi:D-alanyl-D-alanine carboxypeptidase
MGRWGVLLALCAGLPGAGAAGVAPFQGAMAACVAEQSKQGPFSGVVVAAAAGERYVHASGFADARGTVPIGRDTPFRLASVGKVFTRVAIGMLVDGGRLRLSDPVRRHLPELPESFAPITIAQLLEHRAGVAPMTRPDMADGPTMAGARTARELVALVAAKPLAFEAGSREQYSNGGYLLLGAVIEASSGEDYRRYVAQRLFAPLGMQASGFDPGPEAAVPMTRLRGPGQPPADPPQPRIEFAALKASSAGDALSSAADLEILARALLGTTLLSEPTRAAVFPRRSAPWRLGQMGGAAGSNTVWWVFPDSGAVLIVLTNFDPPAGELMGQALAPVLLGQACQPQAPRLAPPGAMPRPPERG